MGHHFVKVELFKLLEYLFVVFLIFGTLTIVDGKLVIGCEVIHLWISHFDGVAFKGGVHDLVSDSTSCKLHVNECLVRGKGSSITISLVARLDLRSGGIVFVDLFKEVLYVLLIIGRLVVLL